MIDVQIISLENSFFVISAAMVLKMNMIAITMILNVQKISDSADNEGIIKDKHLNISALTERLLNPISLDSFDAKPSRLFVNPRRSLRSPSKKKNDAINIIKKYAATLTEANIFLSFRRNTPKKRG